jgi:hypothetical protein
VLRDVRQSPVEMLLGQTKRRQEKTLGHFKPSVGVQSVRFAVQSFRGLTLTGQSNERGTWGVRKGLVHRRIVDFLVKACNKPFFDPIDAKVKGIGSLKQVKTVPIA